MKFIVPNPENPNVASVAEREELSSIFLEVNSLILIFLCSSNNNRLSVFLFIENKACSREDYIWFIL